MKKVTFFKSTLFFALLFSTFTLNALGLCTDDDCHKVVKGNWYNSMTSMEVPFDELSYISIWLDENEGLDIDLIVTTTDNAMHLYDDLYIYYEIGTHSGTFGPIEQGDLTWDPVEEVYTVTQNVYLTFEDECKNSKNGIFRADVLFGIATIDPADGSLIDYPFLENIDLFDELEYDDYSNFEDRSKRFVCNGGQGTMGMVSNNSTTEINESFLSKEMASLRTSEDQGILSSNIAISPNPFTNEFTVRYQLNTSSNVKLVLTDLLGNQLSQKKFDNQSQGTYSEYFVLDDKLSSGVYFLQIFYENKVKTLKLLKSN